MAIKKGHKKKRVVRTLLAIVFILFLIVFFYPKKMISYPDGGWLPGFSGKGMTCKCFGIHTPLVEYKNMGHGYPEEVRKQAKCYGVVYGCEEFSTPIN